MKTTITRTPATDFSPETAIVSVWLPASERFTSIDLSGPRVAFGQITEPTMNWAGIGASNQADATAFAAGLVDALALLPLLSGYREQVAR